MTRVQSEWAPGRIPHGPAFNGIRKLILNHRRTMLKSQNSVPGSNIRNAASFVRSACHIVESLSFPFVELRLDRRLVTFFSIVVEKLAPHFISIQAHTTHVHILGTNCVAAAHSCCKFAIQLTCSQHTGTKVDEPAALHGNQRRWYKSLHFRNAVDAGKPLYLNIFVVNQTSMGMATVGEEGFSSSLPAEAPIWLLASLTWELDITAGRNWPIYYIYQYPGILS
ncbi:hypothetical protein B0H12DRAFT_1087826 [Mycena haematopus]|nr:hypothetical protein B0H12DRAFT_1087826 [Mycena haematopus]